MSTEPTQSPLGADLNQLIVSGVNARVEAAVAAAFASDQMMREYVAAALSHPITVRDPGSYKDRKTTFLHESIHRAIQSATETAIKELIVEQEAEIRAEVKRALHEQAGAIGDAFAGQLVKDAKGHYPLIRASVSFNFPKADG